jgi:Flp pilus assembly pilin Flp
MTMFLKLYVRIKNWLRSDEGQDLIEYALLAFLIAVAVIAILPPVAQAIIAVFQAIIAALTTAPVAP